MLAVWKNSFRNNRILDHHLKQQRCGGRMQKKKTGATRAQTGEMRQNDAEKREAYKSFHQLRRILLIWYLFYDFSWSWRRFIETAPASTSAESGAACRTPHTHTRRRKEKNTAIISSGVKSDCNKLWWDFSIEIVVVTQCKNRRLCHQLLRLWPGLPAPQFITITPRRARIIGGPAFKMTKFSIWIVIDPPTHHRATTANTLNACAISFKTNYVCNPCRSLLFIFIVAFRQRICSSHWIYIRSNDSWNGTANWLNGRSRKNVCQKEKKNNIRKM